MRHEVEGQMKELQPPLQLNPVEFKHSFKSPSRVLKLVTLIPLFPCLNELPKKSQKSEKRKKD